MGSSVNTKIALIGALRNSGKTGSTLAKLVGELSSGLRIDSAATTHLSNINTEKIGKSTGYRNVNDGFNRVRTGIEAMEAAQSLMSQMQELARQAESSSITSDQRTALDNEFQQLRTNYNDIVTNTKYNDQRLFDGSQDSVNVQADVTAASTIALTTGIRLDQGVSSDGVGDGTFQAATTAFPGTGGINDTAVGDLDNDGFDDIVSNDDADKITVGFSNGDGTFTISTFGGVSPWRSVSIGYFNGDSNLDIAGLDATGNVQILLGNGDRTFAAPTVVPSGNVAPEGSMATGDFNNDGKVDLIVSEGGGGNVQYLQGNGDGTFAAGANVLAASPSDQFVDRLSVGDFDNDGDDDAVLGTTLGIQVLKSNGDGTFDSSVVLDGAVDYKTAQLGDVDNDGKLDIVGFTVAGDLKVYIGNGNGTFAAPLTTAAIAPGLGLVMADFNEDGDLDLAIGAGSVALGNGDGTFGAAAATDIAAPMGYSVGDFDGDGINDISGSTGFSVRVILGNGTAGPSASRTLGSLNLLSTSSAGSALSATETKEQQVTNELGHLKAQESRFFSVLGSTSRQSANLDAAVSTIEDIDTAATLASYTATQIRSLSAEQALGMLKISIESVLQLFKN